MSVIARVTTLEELVAVCKLRRGMLGLSQLVLDDISGLQVGYTGKLECGDKGLGKVSLPLLLGGLKLELAVVPATSRYAVPVENTKAYATRSDFFRNRARKARAAQLAKQTPEQRRKLARAAIRTRWARVRAERERAP